MENVRNQRLDMLQKKDRQTFDAIHWLRENQHLFREPILEPIAVSVNIKDRRYEAQVEALLGGRDFFSFVAQNEEDRETFLREVRAAIFLVLTTLNVCMHASQCSLCMKCSIRSPLLPSTLA